MIWFIYHATREWTRFNSNHTSVVLAHSPRGFQIILMHFPRMHFRELNIKIFSFYPAHKYIQRTYVSHTREGEISPWRRDAYIFDMYARANAGRKIVLWCYNPLCFSHNFRVSQPQKLRVYGKNLADDKVRHSVLSKEIVFQRLARNTGFFPYVDF